MTSARFPSIFTRINKRPSRDRASEFPKQLQISSFPLHPKMYRLLIELIMVFIASESVAKIHHIQTLKHCQKMDNTLVLLDLILSFVMLIVNGMYFKYFNLLYLFFKILLIFNIFKISLNFATTIKRKLQIFSVQLDIPFANSDYSFKFISHSYNLNFIPYNKWAFLVVYCF